MMTIDCVKQFLKMYSVVVHDEFREVDNLVDKFEMLIKPDGQTDKGWNLYTLQKVIEFAESQI